MSNRNYDFDGWHGKLPSQLFDLGLIPDCLHATIQAFNIAGNPDATQAAIMDTGIIHELAHMAAGMAICTHTTMHELREKIVMAERSAGEMQGDLELPEPAYRMRGKGDHVEDLYTVEQMEEWGRQEFIAGIERRPDVQRATRAGFTGGFEEGWLACTRWAERRDLVWDMDSQAWRDELEKAMASELIA